MAKEGNVGWAQPAGNTGPQINVTVRGGGIDFVGRVSTLTYPNEATLRYFTNAGTTTTDQSEAFYTIIDGVNSYRYRIYSELPPTPPGPTPTPPTPPPYTPPSNAPQKLKVIRCNGTGGYKHLSVSPFGNYSNGMSIRFGSPYASGYCYTIIDQDTTGSLADGTNISVISAYLTCTDCNTALPALSGTTAASCLNNTGQNGRITVTPGGGTGVYYFTLNGAGSYGIAGSAATNVDGLSDATYAITLYDDGGNSLALTSRTLNCYIAPTGTAGFTCVDYTATNARIDVTDVSGGTGTGYYFTLNGAGSYTVGAGNGPTNLANGTYAVVLYDSYGSRSLGNVVVDCANCTISGGTASVTTPPTPAPAAPTPAAPTPAAPTPAAPTPAAPTPAAPTPAAPTPAAPTPSAPTPAASLFSGTIGWDTTLASEACSLVNSMNVDGDNTTFCNSANYTSLSGYSMGTGNYILSDGSNTVNVSHTTGTNLFVMYGGGCQVCPGAPTPAAPTPAAPTPAAPTPAAPTPEAPTPTPTPEAPTPAAPTPAASGFDYDCVGSVCTYIGPGAGIYTYAECIASGCEGLPPNAPIPPTPAAPTPAAPTPAAPTPAAPTPAPATTYDLLYYHEVPVTGTSNLLIYVNGSTVVDSSTSSIYSPSGNITVNSTDVITYSLSGTSPDFCENKVVVNNGGGVVIFNADCGFGGSLISDASGFSLSENLTLNATTTNFVDSCP
jgi:hypothetical protein